MTIKEIILKTKNETVWHTLLTIILIAFVLSGVRAWQLITGSLIIPHARFALDILIYGMAILGIDSCLAYSILFSTDTNQQRREPA